MEWKCKLCSVSADTRAKLFRHYRLQHGHFSRVCPLPCLYGDCICTFQSFNAMKAHLSRVHNDTPRIAAPGGAYTGHALFTCPLCNFKHPFSEETLFGHLRSHLRSHEMVPCPFKNCNYSTNVYSSFNAHKSRKHVGSSDFDDNVILEENDSVPVTTTAESVGDAPAQCESTDTFDLSEDESQCDTDSLRAQLQHNLASLFLKMRTILHVSDMASQEIVEHLTQIFTLSQPLLKKSILEVLESHDISASETTLDEVVSAVMDSNILVSATARGKELSSTKRRKTYVERNYPVVPPVEYVLEPGHTAVHVPILEMIQNIFRHTDILEKIQETKTAQNDHYESHQDGLYYKGNDLLSSSDELKLPLLLYIDDLEIANPLGTSRKIHKLCSVYWILADLPSTYRSALHVIQLAALCKVTDVQKFGYERALGPLLRDIQTLERDGVFIESIGKAVRGTVMCVVSDNLAAHALAGFTKCFRAEYFCRFCTATQDKLQSCDVGGREFSLRTKASHDSDVHAVMHGDFQSQFGVQGDCTLSQLEYFHTVTGFPPDVLHDLFEGIVPVELALCIGEMIRCKYFTLEYLNRKIASFPYQRTDKVDRPQPIPKTFKVKRTIGGNGHENATLIRLFPLIIGNIVPEGDVAWTVLMDLKDVVEIVLSPTFTEESLQYLQTKIQDHRRMLQETFPDFKLRPKHHYIEHYPDLIRCFGPLVHLWTMRFEGKHRFFKRVVHDTQNFKNVLKTLANRHQHMVAYYLSSPSFFKPHQQTSNVSSVMVSVLPDVARAYIEQITDSNMIYSTSNINIDGTNYDKEMFVSVGQEGALPQFNKIEQILLVNHHVVFLCQEHKSYYIEHLRSYELSAGNLAVNTVSELNDKSPLCAYNIEGRLLLTPKRFILLD